MLANMIEGHIQVFEGCVLRQNFGKHLRVGMTGWCIECVCLYIQVTVMPVNNKFSQGLTDVEFLSLWIPESWLILNKFGSFIIIIPKDKLKH